MRDITIVPQDYIAIHTKTDTVMKKFDDGCEVYEVIEDRRPLVRCRDCKYRAKYTVCDFLGEDDFCSYGERREDSKV